MLVARPYLGFSGLTDLSKGLKERANLDDVKNVVKLNGAELQRDVQRDAPVDTGFLKRSINTKIEDEGFTSKLGIGAYYAPYLISGTRYMYSRDFFNSNFNYQKFKFSADLKRLMK